MPRRRRRRFIGRVVLVSSVVAGALAWRERKLVENQQRYGLP
jgi:hypothetical protein